MEQDKLLQVPGEARIVEIGEAGRSVAYVRGDIVITGDEGIVDRIPILEIAGMVTVRPGLAWSAPALSALSERCVGIVVCDDNFGSKMMTWPVSGQRWPPRVRAQMGLDAPLGRHLRRILMKARDDQRDAAIVAMGKGDALKALRKAAKPAFSAARAGRSRSKTEQEDHIGRFYWSWLVGPGFRRIPAKGDGNAVINFAHTMLRIEAVRAVHKAGLHPSVGLGGAREKGGLVDDLMLPYLPVVDLAAALLIATGQNRMNGTVRDALTGLFTAPLRGSRGLVQIRTGLAEMAASLARCFETGEARPEINLPAVQDPSVLYDRMMGSARRASPSGEDTPD
jgi:CRISPR-associated protein Cas1